MMQFMYRAALSLYGLGILLTSLFSLKSKQWVRGRQHLLSRIGKSMQDAPPERFWIHCSSLGEYELGKPLMRKLKETYPAYRIVLTFFSPSGYEAARDTPLADYVFYLPLDSPGNARRFLRRVAPASAFFIKNDFWHYYIRELRKQKIPSYIVSARFHPSQPYFKWYGRFFERMLLRITHIFVSDQRSLELLYDHGLANVSVCGDMRYDNVLARKAAVTSDPVAEKFCGNGPVLIAGSTWPPDELLLAALFPRLPGEFRMILAPHTVDAGRLDHVQRLFGEEISRYSRWQHGVDASKRILLVDNIGQLPSLYRYGKYAYIGGAFGRGLHNILEAVVYGLPVFFGTGYTRFPEAVQLVSEQAAFSVSSPEQMLEYIRTMESNAEQYHRIHHHNTGFAASQAGATRIILSYLELNFKPSAQA